MVSPRLLVSAGMLALLFGGVGNLGGLIVFHKVEHSEFMHVVVFGPNIRRLGDGWESLVRSIEPTSLVLQLSN